MSDPSRLRDRCIEAAARAEYEHEYGPDTWSRVQRQVEGSWRRRLEREVDAVLAEVAAHGVDLDHTYEQPTNGAYDLRVELGNALSVRVWWRYSPNPGPASGVPVFVRKERSR